jgi:alkanesulfonate monooxygenase SsuD/methylene tetrahydromethanopterin reductase-like flavin-dependent oxidoreductase (luciferase family)
MSGNPLFSDNRLKLGLFGINVSNGCAITSAPGSLQMSWPTTKELAQIADRDGYEALVPVARWKGFGGETNFNGTNFETYTWAAGLGEATDNICIMTTSHVPTVHPIMAAKQGTTIDHITNGRFALNVVCGWFKPELEMFGAPIMQHDVRYEYAAEWIEIVKMLWTREDEFDFEGKYLTVRKGFSMPKPLQRPMPPIMNAGGSGRGQHFAAKYADMAFVILQSHDLEQSKRQVDAYRELARREYGREIQIWSYGYVVQADTQREADEYLHYYVVERGDDAAVDNLTRTMLENAQTLPPEVMDSMKFHFKAGWGGYPLVGTPDRIVTELEKLSKIGLDGVLLSWVDFREGLELWRRDVMPRLEQAGLRRPHRAKAVA